MRLLFQGSVTVTSEWLRHNMVAAWAMCDESYLNMTACHVSLLFTVTNIQLSNFYSCSCVYMYT